MDWSSTDGVIPDQDGVGVFMQQDPGDSRVYVKKVVPGGSAAKSGRIEVGDVIVKVDGLDVVGETVSSLRRRIVGTPGSYVRLGFRRADKMEFEVNLMRGSPDFLNSMQIPRSSDFAPPPPRYDFATAANMDLDAARQRIRQLESQRDSDRLEIERLKSLLQNDRDTSTRYVKEIDNLQRKHSEEVIALQAVLNKSEQQRRELEGIVQSHRAREEEVRHVASRTKDVLDNRELQLADMRRAFEEERARLERELIREKEGRREDQIGRANAESLVVRLQDELKRAKDVEKARRERDERIKNHITEEFGRLNDARILEEKIMGQTRELHLMLNKWESDYFSGLAPPTSFGERALAITAPPVVERVIPTNVDEHYFMA